MLTTIRTSLTLSQVAEFAIGGQVHVAFGRAIAAGNGTLLLVPLDLLPSPRGLVPGCPVPWEEVSDARDFVADPLPVFSEQWAAYGPVVQRLETLGLTGWYLAPMPVPNWHAAAALFIHPLGVRYAITSDLLWGRG